jgi:hypothetical protein
MSDEDDDARAKRILASEPVYEEKFYHRSAPTEVINDKEDACKFLDKIHACNTITGRFKIMYETPDGEIEFMDKKSFIDTYQNMRIQVTTPEEKTKLVPITELWLNWPKRRQYRGIIFNPSRAGHYDDLYNLFDGFKILAREGDCTIFLDYIKLVICDNHEDNYKFLIALIAQMFQEPHLKPGIAVVLRGDEGVGKSFFIEKLGALMDKYYFKTSNPAYIFGDHNGQLKNKLLLHLEEAVWAGSKKEESLIKDLITGRTIEINEKFMPVYSVPNHLHLFISGNPEWLMAAGLNARRLFALHASNAKRLDTEYFSGIDTWFRSGGCAYLMHYFLHYKTDINLRVVPVTDELINQKQHSMSGVEAWVMNIAHTGDMPFGEMVDGGNCKSIKKLLYYDFQKSSTGRNTKMTEREFGSAFLRLLPLVVNGEIQKHDNGTPKSIVDTELKIKGARSIRFNGYGLPSLAVWRVLMDFNVKGKNNWDNKTEWTILRDNDEDMGEIYDKKKF